MTGEQHHDRLEIWGFHVDWTAPDHRSTFQPSSTSR